MTRVLHYHFPGFDGPSQKDAQWCEALNLEIGSPNRFSVAVEIVDWLGGRRFAKALRACRENRATAERLAARLALCASQNPTELIFISAQCAGCAIALWTIENLPPHLRIQSVVLSSPALSRRYDLRGVFRNLANSMYVFTDDSDVIMLDRGTRIFGTSDGLREEAAGRRGFIPPTDAPSDAYNKLRQMPYNPLWRQYGNFGGHNAAMSHSFARNFIGPIVRGDLASD